MKRKPQAKPEPVTAPVVAREIAESAKRSISSDRSKAPAKCMVCGSETSTQAVSGAEQLCWVCRRLKISAWREVEQQMPAQE